MREGAETPSTLVAALGAGVGCADLTTGAEPLPRVCESGQQECTCQTNGRHGLQPCLPRSGETTCEGGNPGDTCAPLPPLAVDDTTCDGVDDGCDGATDADYVVGPTTCGGPGVCTAIGLMTCVDGHLVAECTPGLPADDLCDLLDEGPMRRVLIGQGFFVQKCEATPQGDSPFLLCDMAGSLQERVQDCWHDSYAAGGGAPSDGTAWETDCQGPERSTRGGCWSCPAEAGRVAGRSSAATDYRGAALGFRLARSYPLGP